MLARNRARQDADGRALYPHLPARTGSRTVVGYSSVAASRAGLEQAGTTTSTGADTDLGGRARERAARPARGRTVRGDDVSLAPPGRAARGAWARCARAACAAPSSRSSRAPGAVLVMASWPTFDPNAVDRNRRIASRPARRARSQPRHAGPLPAGLDVQGRDRGDRARRSGTLHAGERVQRSGLPRRVRPARSATSAASAPGTFDLALRAHALDQHDFAKSARSCAAAIALPGSDEGMRALRLLPRSPLDYPTDQSRPPAPCAPAPAAAAPERRRSTSRARRSARRASGHAAADGDGRGRRRERRRARWSRTLVKRGALAGRRRCVERARAASARRRR